MNVLYDYVGWQRERERTINFERMNPYTPTNYLDQCASSLFEMSFDYRGISYDSCGLSRPIFFIYFNVVMYKTDGGGRECALTKWSVQPSPLAPANASSMVHSTAQPEFRIYRSPPKKRGEVESTEMGREKSEI